MAKLVRHTSCVLALFFAASVWAVWNEEVSLIGENPPAAGTTLVFLLPDGEEIEGEVEERDDRYVVVFALPGQRPSAGTIVLEGQRYVIPSRPSSESLTLNLDTAAVTFTQASASGNSVSTFGASPWQFELTGFYSTLYSDHFADQLNDSADEAAALVLPSLGAQSISATSSADDDDTGFGAEFTLRHRLDGPWAWYSSLSYLQVDDFRGIVSATGVVPPGIDVEARSVASSELEILALSFGASHDFGANDIWRLYFGLGATQIRQSDEFVSSVLANDALLTEMAGNANKKERGTVFEFGVQRALGRHFFVSLDAQNSIHAIDSISSVQVGFGLRF